MFKNTLVSLECTTFVPFIKGLECNIIVIPCGKLTGENVYHKVTSVRSWFNLVFDFSSVSVLVIDGFADNVCIWSFP